MGPDVTKPIGYQLKRAQQALRSAMDDALRELEITTAQYAALIALKGAEPLSGAELARRSFVTPQTMNAILVNLEEARLIERSAHPRHGRVIQAQLTPRGDALLSRARSIVEGLEEKMLRGLSRADRLRLAQALRRCERNLD